MIVPLRCDDMGLCRTSTCCCKSKGKLFVILYKPMFINCSSIMGGSSARLVDVGTQLCGTHRAVRIVNKKKKFY